MKSNRAHTKLSFMVIIKKKKINNLVLGAQKLPLFLASVSNILDKVYSMFLRQVHKHIYKEAFKQEQKYQQFENIKNDH